MLGKFLKNTEDESESLESKHQTEKRTFHFCYNKQMNIPVLVTNHSLVFQGTHVRSYC